MFKYLARAEKCGSIYSRIIGLIRSGNLKWEQRPIWFDAYAANPPFDEPNWDIKMEKCDKPVPRIYYKEDLQRAKELLKMRGEEPLHKF